MNEPKMLSDNALCEEWADLNNRICKYESAMWREALYFSAAEKIAWDTELERLRQRKREIEKEQAKAMEKKETPEARAQRLAKRVREEKAKNNRAFNKTVAEEEGISLSRLKQIIGRPPSS